MQLLIDDRPLQTAGETRAARLNAVATFAPRVVIRGETPGADENAAESALVDWLAFTLWLPIGHGQSWLEDALQTVFCMPRVGWGSAKGGWFGYKHRLTLGDYGLLAFGGEAQRGTYHVELNAHGCRLIQDWNAVRLWGETYDARVTRVDLAHDDHQGIELSVARALGWLADGLFTTSGRPPKAALYDDLGSGSGKTLNIGSRGAGKLLRIYEKGRQLGDPSSLWVRAEVEFRNKGRVIPWDVVTMPGQYIAGAYPAFSFLSSRQSRLRTIQRIGQITYDSMVNTLRRQGGKALGVMCQVHQGDAVAVLARVVREGLPKRLCGFADVVGRIVADSAA